MRIKYLHNGECKRLADKFNVSVQSISYALNFHRNSMTDRRIRHYAMNQCTAVLIEKNRKKHDTTDKAF